MTTSRNRTTIRNLAIFIIAVLASGWLGRGLDVLTGNQSKEGLGIFLWIVTPLGLSLILRTFAGDGWKDFGLRPDFRKNAVWYLAALLVYPVMTALVLMIGSGMGLITFPNLSTATFGIILQTFVLSLLPQFIKNIFEEAAWRGYLAPKVYSLGLNAYVGHVIVGFVWGAWHIPYYLFFLDRSILQSVTLLSVAAFIPMSIVVLIAWAVVYGEIRLLTNSVWPAILMHMTEDSLLNQLFFNDHIRITPGTDWMVSPINGIVSIFLFLALGIGLRQLRKKNQAVSTTTAAESPAN